MVLTDNLIEIDICILKLKNIIDCWRFTSLVKAKVLKFSTNCLNQDYYFSTHHIKGCLVASGSSDNLSMLKNLTYMSQNTTENIIYINKYKNEIIHSIPLECLIDTKTK